jgi:hypothetical protein
MEEEWYGEDVNRTKKEGVIREEVFEEEHRGRRRMNLRGNVPPTATSCLLDVSLSLTSFLNLRKSSITSRCNYLSVPRSYVSSHLSSSSSDFILNVAVSGRSQCC